jgi:glycosyltransferase involved in cell wall biosynthesis
LKLSIIIPVYNEEKSIETLLSKIDHALPLKFINEVECIIYNDASSDRSLEIIENYIPLNFKKIIFSNSKNNGKGFNVINGLKQASGNLILIQDGDLELDPSDINSLIVAQQQSNAQLVNGSRYLPGILRPLYAYRRYFFNKLFTNIASFLVDVRFTDLACGYKLLTKELAGKLNLTENRFGIEAEIIIKTAIINKTQIVEVPVHYWPRNKGDGKKIRNIDGLRILWVILKYGLFRKKN